MPKKLFTLLLLALCRLQAVAFAADAPDPLQVFISPVLHPARETAFVPSLEELSAAKQEPAWSMRTGARKGLSGQADTERELFVAPDTAVLARGLSALWPGLLAGEQEASVMVEPWDIAGLYDSKPLLIIPSGALAGTGLSGFFKTSLAEYVRNGGTVFCLSQRRGADLSALPVPEGQRLEGAGWAEDNGPLFRASTVSADHPLTRDLTRPAPAIETDGYLKAFPAQAEVLLARPDGFPTLLVYPFGKGQVVVSTLFTDFSSLLGSPEQEERKLLAHLLAWSKTERRDTRPAAKGPADASRPALASLAPDPALPAVRGALARTGTMLAVELELPGSVGLKDQPVLVRTAGQEKNVVLSRDATHISFALPLAGNERRVSYAVYGKQGRSLARGSLSVPVEPDSKALPARPFYLPGDMAGFLFNSMGKGQVTFEALGFMNDQIIPDKGVIRMEVPRDLPSGTYRILWVFEDIFRNRKEGSFPLDVAGYQVVVDDAAVSIGREKGKLTGRAVFTIRTDRKLSGHMHLLLTRPDGSTISLPDASLALAQGVQSVPLTFTLDRELSGTWELSYRFTSRLPVGPGLPTAPVALEAGSVLFDTGSDAVLALSASPLLQYEAGPTTVTAALVGIGNTTVQVSVDGKEVSSDQKVLSAAPLQYPLSLPALGAGRHTLRVTLSRPGTAPAERSHFIISGLRLPDLAVALHAGDPVAGAQGPFLPLTATIRNNGKSRSGPVRLAFAQGDPAAGGTVIGGMDIPALAPKEQTTRTLEWLLYQNAGVRTVTAMVDQDGKLEESNKSNNRASVTQTVPELLLLVRAPKTGFSSTDRISLPLSIFNLTSRSYRGLALRAGFTSPAGRELSSEILPVPEIKPGAAASLEQTLKSPVAPVGTYTLSASVTAETELAAASVQFPVLPTLMFTGSLEDTPSTGVQCRPFTIRAAIRSTGNVLPSSGTARLEVLAPDKTEPLLVRTYPLAAGQRKITIDSLDVPLGNFMLRFAISAANEQYKVSRDMVLLERALTVTGPVEAKRLEGAFPRVLVLWGREGRVVEQALAETMLQQAFDQQDALVKIVDSEDAFMGQAMTGMFNVYVLFEPQEPIKTAWLKERIEQGQGVVVIGSGPVPRTIGEDLGFSFRELQGKRAKASMTFSERSVLGLTGSMPVSGTALQVRKAGAETVAYFGSSDQPAIVIDSTRKGKVVIAPLSVSHSAFEDGTTAQYSLVVRKAGLLAAPEGDAGGPLSGGISVASTGDVPVRVVENLPAGSQVLWSGPDSTVKGTTITYQVKAGREPRKLLYVYLPGTGEKSARSAEILYDCAGTYKSMGKLE